MKIQLRVAHLLGLDRENHESQSRLASKIGISRHQLLHLLDNDAPQIRRKSLEMVCQYLIGHGIVAPEDLPQALFGVEPDSFWPMLAARQRVEIFMGVRWLKRMGVDQQVVAADAVLQSVIVNHLTGVAAEGTALPSPCGRHPQQVINLELVVAWGAVGTTYEEIEKRAKKPFRSYCRDQDDKSIVCVGSIKSNPMCDPVIAHGLRGTRPFQSQDSVRDADQRHSPFVMIYRPDDPQPASCWAGRQLATNSSSTKPGIYYQVGNGKWDFAPCNKLNDVALVYYRFQKARKRLEMVFGGFSGRSTRGVAEMLRRGEGEKFWPPVVDTDTLDAGAYIIRFKYRARHKNEGNEIPPHKLEKSHEVIPLRRDVLARCLKTPG